MDELCLVSQLTLVYTVVVVEVDELHSVSSCSIIVIVVDCIVVVEYIVVV